MNSALTEIFLENDSRLRTHAATVVSTEIGFIEATGPEARSFLQNLGTNDLRPLTPGTGCETFFTTHKARIVGHAIVSCLSDDSFLIAVESGRAESVFKHLDHHLISERLELIAPSPKWSQLRIVGLEAERWAENAAGGALADLKPWAGKSLDTATGAFVRRQGALHLPGFDFIGPAEWIETLAYDLRIKGLASVDDANLEVIRIESSWPRWGQEMDENRFVVELGRTATAISYAKGCYLGQEPIVMARDRGQINRQLMGFHSEGETPPPAGTKVMLGEIEQFKVTSAAYSPAWKGVVGLGYAYRGQQTPGTTVEAGEFRATLASLPMIPPG